jgi:hypothetical protein
MTTYVYKIHSKMAYRLVLFEKKHGDPQFFFLALFYLDEKLTISEI